MFFVSSSMGFKACFIAIMFMTSRVLSAPEPKTLIASSEVSPHRVDPDLPHGCDKQLCDRQMGPGDWEEMGHIPDYPVRSSSALAAELESECLLWNSSCTGNRSAAVENFFNMPNGTMNNLMSDLFNCFNNQSQPSCTPAMLAEYAEMKSWMRTPECDSLHDKALQVDLHTQVEGQKCCGNCSLGAGNVDVYYWPQPNADTSCLSIIGNEVLPLTYGITDKSYWGCTSTDPEWGLTTITTAILMTADLGVTWKSYLVDPFSSQPCPEPTNIPPSLTATSTTLPSPSPTSRYLPIQSSSWKNGSIVTTISGTFTLWVLGIFFYHYPFLLFS